MEEIVLRNLVKTDKQEFYKALESEWKNGFVFAHYWESLGKESFEKYIEILPEFSLGKHIPANHVPCTILFAFNEKNQLVGRTSIRHKLTDELLNSGGHIGYGVVSHYRQKGHATIILEKTLIYIRKKLPQLNRVLLICDEDNVASQRIIEKNGGIAEKLLNKSDNNKSLRYWISL